MNFSLGLVLFFGIAAFLVVCAVIVSFSRSIVYSGFSLLGTFFAVAALYLFLSSDFVGITQLLIYVGGILILVLFAIMLTNQIQDIQVSNQSINRLVGSVLCGGLFFFLTDQLLKGSWVVQGFELFHSMVVFIGEALLTEYLLPFEIISILLLAALVGAAVLVRREVR